MKKGLLVLLCIILMPLTAWASGVSGSYRSAGNKSVDLSIKVGKPAPKAFIVIQHFPAGVQLISAKPKPAAFLKGGAKWLFKNVHPGNINISMQFSESVSPSSLKGEIRFGQGKNNSMKTVPIR